LNEDRSIYKQLDEKGTYLKEGLHGVLKKFDAPFVINQLGSMISVHFSEAPVVDLTSASTANNALFNRFFHAMLRRGIYLPPSAFESWFLNNALTYEDLDATIGAAEESMRELV
jgi:glutamate-1-semialdehyde 2,1-aminomutase